MIPAAGTPQNANAAALSRRASGENFSTIGTNNVSHEFGVVNPQAAGINRDGSHAHYGHLALY